MFFIILFSILGGVLVIGALACIGAYVGERKNALDNDERAELVGLRTLVHSIDRIAYQNRDINPEAYAQITDEISKFKESHQ